MFVFFVHVAVYFLVLHVLEAYSMPINLVFACGVAYGLFLAAAIRAEKALR